MARGKTSTHLGWVYFIRSESPEPYVKIGWCSVSPITRMRTLQTGCPFKLTMLGCYPGTMDDEYHLRLSLVGSKVRGEWHRITTALLEAIASASAPDPALAKYDTRREAGLTMALKAQRREAGLCPLCGRPGNGYSLCEKHRAEARLYKSRYDARHRNRAALPGDA